MQRIDVSTAVAVRPAPAALGTPGYFTDGDPVGGIPATVVDNDWANSIQEEIMSVLTAASITADKTKVNQLRDSIRTMIQGQSGAYVVDTGAANAYVATLSPAAAAYTDNLVFSIKIAHDNTTASTVNVNGLGAIPVVTLGAYAPLQGGEFKANGIATFRYNSSIGGGSLVLLSASGGTAQSGRLVNIQVISATGTYTPDARMKNAIVEVQGGGGGSGGTGATAGSTSAATGGGSSGSYAKGFLTAAAIGASVACTIGAAGAAATAGANSGGNGGTTSFGALISAPGGIGSPGCAAQTAPFGTPTSIPGSVATGGSILNTTGISGAVGLSLVGILRSGAGGGSPMFNGGGGGKVSSDAVGSAGDVPGAGGGGTCSSFSNGARAGAAGAAGCIIVYEFA